MFILAWKNLTQNKTQFLLSVGGVMLALLLMLALDALLAGSEETLVAYIERSGADIFVSQEGVKNMHMAASSITQRDVSLASRASGVNTVSPILYTTGVIKVRDANILSYIIGFDPDEPLGGPRKVIKGTTNLMRDQTIVDEAVALSQEVGLGDEVEIFGDPYTIVGITRGMTNIINSVSFIHKDDFQEIRPGDSLSYGLISLKPGFDPRETSAAINKRNDEVLALPVDDFSFEERQIIKDMSVELLFIMNLAGFLIGLAVTALTLYTNTLRKRKEYGVMKAIGALNRHLFAVVASQALISLIIGILVAVGFVRLMGLVLPIITPGMGMLLTQNGVTRVVLSSLVIGTFSALIPAWQLSRLDPAQVFRA